MDIVVYVVRTLIHTYHNFSDGNTCHNAMFKGMEHQYVPEEVDSRFVLSKPDNITRTVWGSITELKSSKQPTLQRASSDSPLTVISGKALIAEIKLTTLTQTSVALIGPSNYKTLADLMLYRMITCFLLQLYM